MGRRDQRGKVARRPVSLHQGSRDGGPLESLGDSEFVPNPAVNLSPHCEGTRSDCPRSHRLWQNFGLFVAIPLALAQRPSTQRQSSKSVGHCPYQVDLHKLRELALQVTAGFQKISLPHFDLRVLTVYGGDGMQAQLRSIQKGADIVVATPGRLIDFINRGAMKLNSLECVILD